MVPSIILGIFFVSYFSFKQFVALDTQLEGRGLASALRLANAAEYGTFSANEELLQNIAREALSEPDARSIVIYNFDLKTYAQAGPDMFPAADPKPYTDARLILTTPDSLRFRIPISGKRMEFFTQETREAALILGWLELEMSTANTRVLQYRQLLTNILILLVSLGFTVVTAFLASQGITGPIRKITDIVARIREGELESRVEDFPEKEIQSLGEGINAMAGSLQGAYREMQSNIDQATHDLRETLETIEVQNIELDMARREALEASRIKSEFLANMSHEIRTPLNGIIGFTKLLEKSNLDRKQEDYVNTIYSSSESLLTIINDVLDFAKIEAGKLLLDNRSMNLRDTIEDVLTMLAPQAQAKNLELVTILYTDVPAQIISDQLRIKQVITNLVSNAIKFTPEGSVVVRAALEQSQNKKITIKVSVSDTGIGLSKDQQKALFHAFQQADSSTAREFGGTGLGLAISKRLVEQMGGDIGLESEVDQGSTFWFTLRTEIATEIQQQPSQIKLRGKKVILFDADELARLSLGHMFNDWDVEIIEAQELAAINSLLKDQTDILAVIIGLDYKMSLDTKVHKIIQKIEADTHPEVVVLTSGTEGQHLIEQNDIVCLNKPIRKFKLYETLIQPSQLLQASAKPSKEIEKESEQAKNLRLLNSPKILAVDDHPANLKLIKTLLNSMGAITTTVDSGSKALDAMEKNDFDLVFMDIQMPQMDGLEATERIRASEAKNQHTPIVALTAHALAGEKENLIQRGMDDYLTKPVSEDQLQKTIFKWTGANLSESSEHLLPDDEQDIPDPLISVSTRITDGDDEDTECVSLLLGLQRAGGKLGLAKEMFSMLLESLEQEQAKMSAFYQEGNYDSLLEQVHRLHGATHYCGVEKLQRVTEHTETILKQEKADEIEDALFLVYEEIDEIQRWAKSKNWKKDFDAAVKIYAKQLKPYSS